MWIEDKETKIIREAKIKAKGACCYHKGHFDGNSYVTGIMTVISGAIIVGFICSIAVDFKDDAVRRYASEHPPVMYSYPLPTAPSTSGGSFSATCDSNGSCTIQ